jgi:hypothetical protein
MSYNAGPTERRAGQVRFYSGGTRAGVVFFDGAAMSMPAEPFMKVGLAPGDAFVMVVTRVNGKVVGVTVSRMAPPRLPDEAKRRTTPKMYDRVGRGLSTRKKPAV